MRVSLGAGQRIAASHDWTLLLALADLAVVSGDTPFELTPLDVLLVEGRCDLRASVGQAPGDACLIGIDGIHA